MSSTAPLNIAQAADLVDRSIQKIFMKTSDPEVQYPKYFNVRTTEDYYEKDSSLSGLGEADFVEENSVIVSDIPIQGYDKLYTQNQVGLIYPITWKMWKYGIKRRDLNNAAKELKAAVARKKEKLCAERLTNGFESTSYTHYGINGTKTISTAGGDSLGAFEDDHTREDGGTNINNIVYDGTTYNLPFDYSGWKAALRTASLFVDPRGNPRPAKLDTVVCKTGSSVYFKAMEILGAIKSGKIPESMDNDGAGTPAFKVITLDYLANDAYWFAFDSSRALTDAEGFQFVESQPTTIDPVNIVYKTKEIQTSVTAAFDLGHNDVARCWVGSKGDSSSPSD
jgi:hypothetical protein